MEDQDKPEAPSARPLPPYEPPERPEPAFGGNSGVSDNKLSRRRLIIIGLLVLLVAAAAGTVLLLNRPDPALAPQPAPAPASAPPQTKPIEDIVPPPSGSVEVNEEPRIPDEAQ